MSQERSKVIQMRNKLIVLLTVLMLMVTSAATVFAAPEDDIYAGLPDDLKEALIDSMGTVTDISKEIAGGNVTEVKLQEEPEEWSGDAIDYNRWMNEKEAFGRKSEYSEGMSASETIDSTTEYYSFTVRADKKLIGISLGAAINGVANIIFGLAKMWIGFCAKITGWALNFEMYQTLQSGIDNILKTVTGLAGNTLTRSDEGLGGMIWLGVAFSLASVTLLFFRRQTSGAFGKLLGTIFIVTLIGSYMILPNNFMGWTQSFATSVGSSILGSGNTTTPGDSATKSIWLMGVDQPWQDIEFGGILIKAEDGGALKKGSEVYNWMVIHPKDRGDADVSGDPPQASGHLVGERMVDEAATQALKVGQSLFILIVDLVLGLLFLLLAAVALGFQIGSIVMWILGFFVLIIALFPTHGVGKIKDWGATLALTYFGQIVVYVILLFVTQIMSKFFELGELTHVFGAMAGLAAGIYIMRRPIMSLFSGGGGALRDAGGGAVIDMGRAARSKLGGGYKGDSTERFMPSPVRQNREAKRQVQKEAKMQKYRGKLEEKEAKQATKQAKQAAKQERSVTRAAAGYAGAKARDVKDKMTAPVQSAVAKANVTKGEVAEKLRSRQAETEARTEQRQVARQDSAKKALEEKRMAKDNSASRQANFTPADRKPDAPVMRAEPPAPKVGNREVSKPSVSSQTRPTVRRAPMKDSSPQRVRRSNAPPKKMKK